MLNGYDAGGAFKENDKFFDFRALSSTPITRPFDVPVKFYTLVPMRLKPLYYELLRTRYWIGGYVPGIHNKLLSTQIVATIGNLVSNKIMSGGIKFDGDDSAEDFVNKWSDATNFKYILKSAVRNTQDIGYAFLKTDICDGVPTPRVVYGDQSFFTMNNDKIIDFKSSINAVDGLQDEEAIHKIEHRYYHEITGVPMVESFLVRASTQFDQAEDKMKSATTRGNQKEIQGQRIENISSEIALKFGYTKDQIQEFKDSMKPRPLPMRDLGVYMIKATDVHPKYMKFNIGQSLSSQIGEDNLIRYEIASSLESHEMVVAPQLIMVPSEMENNSRRLLQTGDEYEPVNKENYFNKKQLNGTYYINVPYMNNEGEKIEPKAVEFNIRSGNIKEAKADILRDIARAIGLNPDDLESLSSGVYQAKQEGRTSTPDTIQAKRELVIKAVNDFLKNLLWMYNFDNERLTIMFSNTELEEFDQKVQTYSTAIKNFLMSQETAIKRLFTDMTESEIKEEIEKIKDTKDLIVDAYYGGDKDRDDKSGPQDKNDANVINGENENNDEVSKEKEKEKKGGLFNWKKKKK